MTKLRLLINKKIHPIKYIAMSAGKSVDSIMKYADRGVEPGAKATILIAKLFKVSPEWLWLDEREDIEDYYQEMKYVESDNRGRIIGVI